MNNHHEKVLQIIDSSFLGIIWLSEKNIDYNLGLYAQLDYLFDGLITFSKNKIQDKKKEPFLLQAKNFDGPLFLAIPSDPSNTHEIMNIANSRSNDKKKNILIISDQTKSYLHTFKDKDLSFQEILL